MTLQNKIDCLAEYDTLVLEFDEYFEKIELNKPITLDGGDSTICFTSGPVVTVNSKDVELRNIHLEVTSSGDLKDKAASLALKVKENERVTFENVIVKGDVEGVIIETGAWRYPDVLNIRPVAPAKTNYFVFEMDVPVSCALETEIEDLRIINPALSPGLNRVLIEVSDLKKDTILFGQIGIKSAYFKRMISVSGGSFGVPDYISAPVKSEPISLNSLSAPFKEQTSADQREINRQRSDIRGQQGAPDRPRKRSDARSLEREESTLFKITNYDFQRYKQYLKIGAIFIFIALMVSVSIYLIIRKSVSNNGEEQIPAPAPEPTISTTSIPTPTPKPTQPPNTDKIKPEGKLSGIKAQYNNRKYGRIDIITEPSVEIHIEPDKNSIKNIEYPIKYGYLNINTKPWAAMSIYGREIGITPKANLKLPAGVKKIRFVNKEYKIDTTREVSIIADRSINLSFDLTQ